jgi:hypothetical protein
MTRMPAVSFHPLVMGGSSNGGGAALLFIPFNFFKFEFCLISGYNYYVASQSYVHLFAGLPT